MSGDTVTGKALQFTNDNKHCYAYSGEYGASTTAQTMLSFTTNSSYINSILQCNGFINVSPSSIGGGSLGAFTVSFDGVRVANLKVTGSSETAPYSITQPLIIPPLTDVVIECISSADSSTYKATATLTGKVGMPQRVGNLDE